MVGLASGHPLARCSITLSAKGKRNCTGLPHSSGMRFDTFLGKYQYAPLLLPPPPPSVP